MTKHVCKVNGCDLRGEPIPERSLLKGYYGKWELGDPPRYYSKLIGIEIEGGYDGVSVWLCPVCRARWNRFGKVLEEQ